MKPSLLHVRMRNLPHSDWSSLHYEAPPFRLCFRLEREEKHFVSKTKYRRASLVERHAWLFISLLRKFSPFCCYGPISFLKAGEAFITILPSAEKCFSWVHIKLRFYIWLIRATTSVSVFVILSVVCCKSDILKHLGYIFPKCYFLQNFQT